MCTRHHFGLHCTVTCSYLFLDIYWRTDFCHLSSYKNTVCEKEEKKPNKRSIFNPNLTKVHKYKIVFKHWRNLKKLTFPAKSCKTKQKQHETTNPKQVQISHFPQVSSIHTFYKCFTSMNQGGRSITVLPSVFIGPHSLLLDTFEV